MWASGAVQMETQPGGQKTQAHGIALEVAGVHRVVAETCERQVKDGGQQASEQDV